MPPTKICHLTSAHNPFDNRIFEKQCKTIKAAGYDMVLVAPHDHDEVVDGIQIKAVPRSRSRLQRMFVTAWRTLRVAWAENADLYQIHDPELLPWTIPLRLRGKPVIFDMHENMPAAIRTKFWLPPVLRKPISWAFRATEPFIMFRMPVIFAEEAYRKDYLWVRKYTFVLNLPDLSILLGIRADEPFPQPTVGYIGTVTRDRGAEATLDALHLLQQENLDVQFECVGAPRAANYISTLEEKVAQYGLQDTVHFRGFMRPQEGWGVMARCHIGLVLMHPTPNNLGSAHTKIYEYMALGLPQIGSTLPLHRELIEGNRCGLCVDPTDPRAIAYAIRYLLEHPEEAREMGQRGREIVQKKYNWSTEGDKLLALYRAELDSTPAQA